MGFKWTVLVGEERKSDGLMAAAIPMKGGMGMFAIDKRLEFIEGNGDRELDIMIKSDQESSAQYLVNEIVERRVEGRAHVEESPVKSSGSS